MENYLSTQIAIPIEYTGKTLSYTMDKTNFITTLRHADHILILNKDLIQKELNQVVQSCRFINKFRSNTIKTYVSQINNNLATFDNNLIVLYIGNVPFRLPYEGMQELVYVYFLLTGLIENGGYIEIHIPFSKLSHCLTLDTLDCTTIEMTWVAALKNDHITPPIKQKRKYTKKQKTETSPPPKLQKQQNDTLQEAIESSMLNTTQTDPELELELDTIVNSTLNKMTGTFNAAPQTQQMQNQNYYQYTDSDTQNTDHVVYSPSLNSQATHTPNTQQQSLHPVISHTQHPHSAQSSQSHTPIQSIDTGPLNLVLPAHTVYIEPVAIKRPPHLPPPPNKIYSHPKRV